MEHVRQEKPYLALCMIVRDAGSSIDKLLDSVAGAFDEYVFVDTGSIDDTRQKILRRFQRPEDGWPTLNRSASAVYFGTQRLVFATFDWIDDFAAARNFSFSLAEATWRGYLDADDEFPLATKLRQAIQDIETKNPKVNSIVLPYVYAPGFLQDKFRFVKWAEGGWAWKDEIHESLFSTKAPRFVHQFDNLPVIHHQDGEEKRIGRNIRICQAVFNKASSRGDLQKVGLMAYYLGQYHSVAPGEEDKALTAFQTASDHLGDTNIACEARFSAARLCILKGKIDWALNWAAMAVARTPEMLEGHAILGVIQYERQDWPRAVMAFDHFFSMPRPVLRSTYDMVFFDGTVPAAAAYAYLQVGRLEEAFKALGRVSLDLWANPNVRPLVTKAFQAVQLERSIQVTRDLWENLVHNDEPMKAEKVLDLAPEAAQDHPAIQELRRMTKYRLRHLQGWADYKKCYSGLRSSAYDPIPTEALIEGIRMLARAKTTREWAAGLGDEGAPVRVLTIGPQDCNMERDMLCASKRIHLVASDASVRGEGAIERLATEFPGRVSHHQMAEHYDWIEGEAFDAIMMFEVLEHVPSDVAALNRIRGLLRYYSEALQGPGIFFLSTPIAGSWTNPTLSTNESEYDWWGHVRSNSARSLWDKILGAGLDGQLWGTEHNQCFLAVLHHRDAYRKPPSIHHYGEHQRHVSIYVPGTPTPFDAETHLHQHLGGSEEAVIYLSAELAKRGHTITVYCPRPSRSDGKVLYAKDGVLWRSLEEFDPMGDSYGTVLFWRCPQLMLDSRVQAGKYRKVLWLHDQFYGASPDAYKAADKVVVLSKSHSREITYHDHFLGPFHIAANGIDPDLFPELTPEDEKQRDPMKCVYGSSPDRGLDRILLAWPRIKEAVPEATLDIYYSWALLEKAMERLPDYRAKFGKLREMAEMLSGEGVTVKGGVDQKTLAQAYRHAGLWLYPSSFSEISCITAMKVQAAGVDPCCTDTCALAETVYPLAMNFGGAYNEQLDGHLERFTNEVIRRLRKPMPANERKLLSDRARERFSWAKAADLFEDVL